MAKLALGAADLLIRILEHKAQQRWPGLKQSNPTGSQQKTAEGIANDLSGTVHGPVVQARDIGELHIHHPGEPPGEALPPRPDRDEEASS